MPFGDEVYDGKRPRSSTSDLRSRPRGSLRAHATAGEKRRTRNHYLKGSIFCGRCGGRLVYNLAAGNGGMYSYRGHERP